jgi:hypothetical protein
MRTFAAYSINGSFADKSCRSRKLSMLWRNFPKADIRAGAQHFATLDDRNAGRSRLLYNVFQCPVRRTGLYTLCF